MCEFEGEKRSKHEFRCEMKEKKTHIYKEQNSLINENAGSNYNHHSKNQI